MDKLNININVVGISEDGKTLFLDNGFTLQVEEGVFNKEFIEKTTGIKLPVIKEVKYHG